MSSESRQESFIQRIQVNPRDIDFGTINNSPKIYVTFIFRQTTSMVLTTYDEEAKATKPGLIFRVHRGNTLESAEPLLFNMSCISTVAALHRCLTGQFRLSKDDQEKVIKELTRNINVNEGYKYIRFDKNNDEQLVWSQSVQLEVTIDQANINHLCMPPKLRPRSSKMREEGRQYDDCSICLRELDDTLNPLSRLGCEHIFHQNCIAGWLETISRKPYTTPYCPLCRGKVPLGELINCPDKTGDEKIDTVTLSHYICR